MVGLRVHPESQCPSWPVNDGLKKMERGRKQYLSPEEEERPTINEVKKKGWTPGLSFEQKVYDTPKVPRGRTGSRLKVAVDSPLVLDAFEKKSKTEMVRKSKEPKTALDAPFSKSRKKDSVSVKRQAVVDASPAPSASLSWDERTLNWLLKYGGRMAAFLHLHFKQVLSCVLIAFMCVLWACKYFYLLSSDSIKSSIAVHLSLAVQLLIDIKDVSKQCVAKTLQTPKTNTQEKQLSKDKEIVVETWTDLWHYLLDCHFRAWAVVSNALDYIAIRSMMAAGGLCMILVLPFALLFALAALLLWYYRCIMLKIAWTEKKIERVLSRIRRKFLEVEKAVEKWMMPFLRAARFYRRSFVDQLEQRSSVLRELVGPELGFTLALLASMLWTVDAFMADAHLENSQEPDCFQKLFFLEESCNLGLTEDELRLVEAIPDGPRRGFYLGPHSCPPSPRIPRPVHRQRRECLYLRQGQSSSKTSTGKKNAVDLLSLPSLPSLDAVTEKVKAGAKPAEPQRTNTALRRSTTSRVVSEVSTACSTVDSVLSCSSNNATLRTAKHVRRVAFVDLSSRSFQDSVVSSGGNRDGSRPRGGILRRKEDREEGTDQQVNRFIISIRGDQTGHNGCESSRMEKGFASTGRVREYANDWQADPSPTFRCTAPEKRRPYGTLGLSTTCPKPVLSSSLRRCNSRLEREGDANGDTASDHTVLSRSYSLKGKGKEDSARKDRKMKQVYTFNC